MPAQSLSPEGTRLPQRGRQRKHIGWLQEVQVVRVPWDNHLLEPAEDRVEGHCKKKTTRWTALSYTPGRKELSPGRSREFHVCDAVTENISQATADEIRLFVFSSTRRSRED